MYAGRLVLCSCAVGLFAAGVFACSDGPREELAQERDPVRSLAVHTVALDNAMRNAPIAFRPSGDGLTARGRRHVLTVSADRVSLTPRVDGKAARAVGFRTVILGASGTTTAFEASSATSVSRTVQGVRERIENDDGHLEHVWEFPTRPSSSITVRVEVDGYAYADETESGLRLVDRGSGVSVRYGHATWIDARGLRTAVRARWAGRSIDLALDERLLDGSVFPATLDPIISVELEPDAPVLVPDLRGQGTASVATSATTSLAIFEIDDPIYQQAAPKGMYTVRLGPDGVPIDPCGVPVSTDSTGSISYGSPTLTFGGGIFLAAWVQTASCAFEVRVRRLDPAGTLLDAADLVLAAGSSCSFSGYIRVAFDGSRFLVVWVNYETETLSAATVDPDGTLGTPFPIATVEGMIPAVAGLPGGGWIVGWAQQGPPYLFLTRLGADGTILDPGTMVPGSWGASSPSLASSGSDLLVAWAGNSDIQAQRLDATGSPVGGTISVTSDPAVQARPAAAWDGSAWFLIWEAGDPGDFILDAYARRVSPTGTLLGASDMLVFEHLSGQFPRVARTPGGVVAAQSILPDPAVWSQRLSSIRRYDSAGVALDAEPVPLVRCGNRESRPAVAWNGSEYLVVWEDNRNGPETDIYGVRVAANGTVLDPIAIPISTAPMTQEDPVVVSDGTDFFVMWEDYRTPMHRDFFGTLVDGAGVVGAPNGTLIHTSTIQESEWQPVIAAGSGRFFIAWEKSSSEVRARVLGADAVPLTPIFTVSTSPGLDLQPCVSYGDNMFIVSFGGSARRYDLNGTAMDPTPISLTPSFGGFCSFAASDDSWLFTFNASWAVRARRVAFDGTVPEPAPSLINALSASSISQSVAGWDGEQFLVVWHEAPASYAPHTLYASRVTREAESVDTTPVALTDGTVTALPGGVAGGPPGSFLVVFQEWESAAPYVNDRVRAILVTVDGADAGTSCSSGTECRSGLCVDGACCQVRCGDGAGGDCAACSAAGGGSVDGMCTPIAAGPICRPAAGECDVTDTCDGMNRACPPDEAVVDGTPCAGGVCNDGVCMPPLPDAAPPDATPPDATPAPPDAALPDAASIADAQLVDASPPSADAAGAQDAGGTVDASALGDASNADADIGTTPSSGGCGCRLARRGGQDPIAIVWLTLVALVILRRRARCT